MKRRKRKDYSLQMYTILEEQNARKFSINKGRQQNAYAEYIQQKN